MKKATIFTLALTLVFAISCKKDRKETETKIEEPVDQKAAETEMKDVKITVPLTQKSGSNVTGNAVFIQENGMVKMVAIVSGLTEGTHAIHLHEKADCSSDDGKSTGGHWNPTAQPHGEFGNAAGYHKGDIGNFTANEDGNGTITFITKEWCIGCGDDTKDILGKAIIIHQGTDDFTSQPSGAAGTRVSCGGVIQ